MEEVTYQWSAKVPSGHMWLKMIFTVRFHDDVNTAPASSSNSDLEDAGIGLSDEMAIFLRDCQGKTHIDKKEFIIRFSNAEDFMRFNLIGMESRNLTAF